MYRYLFSFLLSVIISYSVFAQTKYQNDYHSPLGIPLVLSSNFGELRPNHFHMGLDFKTNGKIGYRLYSVEKGHVSRIKVSPYGYGKVVYIDHPNGVTSVYAHCSEFKGPIDSIVKATQIEQQNYAVEVFPKKGEIPVSKGQVIAISGNTGGSTAPHLHFELRDTKTEHALNPLVYGFDMADQKKPEIRGVKIYGVTKNGYRYEGKEIKRTVISSKGSFTVSDNKITIPAHFSSKTGGIGFAFDVIDRLDGANNQCGLYGSLLIVNNDTIFEQRIDRIPFESTRYVNCHKDYAEYQKNKKKYHKSFRTRENDLLIYIGDKMGILTASPGEIFKIKFIAFDPKGNTSELNFELVISQGKRNEKDSIARDLTFLQPSQSMRVENGKTTVDFGIGTVYEPLRILDKGIERSIGKANVPIHKAYRIKIHSEEYQDGKHYIEMITAKGRRKNLLVNYDKNAVLCDSKYFGKYELKRDTIPPRAVPFNFSSSSKIMSKKVMQWKISDIGTGIEDYDLFIEGEWKLLEYEYKNGLVTYSRTPDVIGTKKVVLQVKDDCGNITEWRRDITFN